MDTTTMLVALIMGPIIFGLLAYVCPGYRSRSAVVYLAGLVTVSAGLMAAFQGPFTLSLSWGQTGVWCTFILVVLEDLIIIYLGWRFGSLIIATLGLVKFVLTFTEEIFRFREPFLILEPEFVLDPLALILVLIICIIGSFIAIYALGYMRHHEEHAPSSAADSRRFFLFLVGFLGVMNGLVLSNTIQWMIIFWEATTLCSVMLISHDGTEEALSSAKQALLICAFGGLANTAASLWSLVAGGVSTLSGLMAIQSLVPLALLCLGAMTKSALIPFQGWLLGAMIAPTPVSALLHSSTMVKAGSYLILRLSPAFSGYKLMAVLALAGGFTFALAAALAIGQSNSKKVLAYSTISNLGLIVACAGLNTPLAYAAALLVLCFHAMSKGLLFLCVGSIEQTIGSRDIEDMGGIRYRMPMTTRITLIGMASMLIPPFGMLLSKWMAIEASIGSPLILLLMVLGSAFTVVFWVKWMGRIQTVSYHPETPAEQFYFSMKAAMFVLTLCVILSGVAAVPIHQYFFDPLVIKLHHGFLAPEIEAQALAQLRDIGEFNAWPIFLLLGLAFLVWLITRQTFKIRHLRLPFMCGENWAEEGLFYSFHGLKDECDTAWVPNIYLTSVFQESRITFWANLLAGMIIVSMFSVVGL